MLETLPTTQDQRPPFKLLLAESRQLCKEAIEVQTVTELLLKKTKLQMKKTKQLYEELQSTVNTTDQLFRKAVDLQVERQHIWHDHAL